MQLRVLTYNIHKGFCFYSREYVLERLKESIQSVHADIVFLQEVMGVHPEREQDFEIESQFEYLADSLWSHFAYGQNAVYSSGHHGNAILSKFPFVRHSNLNISTNPFEQRGILHAEISFHERPLHLFCLHFDLLERGRNQQLQWLSAEVESKVGPRDPVIVAGDFNDWRQRLSESLILRMNFSEIGLAATGRHLKTYPSWFPFWSMDRVYVRDIQVVEAQVLKGHEWRRMSDHLPLVADLEINLPNGSSDTRANS